MEVKDLIGEATEYDKKQKLEIKKPKSWCKSVSAFANTMGGFLVFGISDAGECLGLEDPNGDAEKISERKTMHFPNLRKDIKNGQAAVLKIKIYNLLGW